MTKRTRFKLTVWNNMFFQIAAIISMFLQMNDVAIACISEIGIVTAFYIGGDSFRKSKN